MLFILLLFSSLVSAQCFFRNGELAIISEQSYVKCANAEFCCLPTDTCGENGLCVDVNNHANGSLTTLNGETYNFTGLYQTPACSNSDWTGCQTQCSSSQSSSRAYIWSCNDANTEYCCAGAVSVLDSQKGCCSTATEFELTAVNPTETTTTASSTATQTATSTSSSATATATLSSSTTSGLSQGAKVGIGVGVAGGVIAIAAIVTIFCCVLRKRKKRVLPQAPHSALPTTEVPERPARGLSATTLPPAYQPKKSPEPKRPGMLLAEVDGRWPVPAEMAAGQDRSHELP